jgi:hypothetical protein
MTDSEYTETQARLCLIAQFVAIMDLDLDGFLDRIALAEGFSPIVDPTLYLRGSDRLEAVRHLAVATRQFRDSAAASLKVLQQPVPGGRELP